MNMRNSLFMINLVLGEKFKSITKKPDSLIQVHRSRTANRIKQSFFWKDKGTLRSDVFIQRQTRVTDIIIGNGDGQTMSLDLRVRKTKIEESREDLRPAVDNLKLIDDVDNHLNISYVIILATISSSLSFSNR